MTPSLIPTGTRCRHRIGKSSPARRDSAWDEASPASTIKRSEGRKGVETTQSGYGLTTKAAYESGGSSLGEHRRDIRPHE